MEEKKKNTDEIIKTERKDKKRISDRAIQLAILVIGLIGLILGVINMVNQQKTDILLGSISYNTYSPNPFLNINANCYTMEQEMVKKYFGSLSNHAGYVDVFELGVTNTLGTNPWMKITLPKGIYPLGNWSNIPTNVEMSKDESEPDRNIISIQWSKEMSPAMNSIRFMILYDKKDLDTLVNDGRMYSYGIKESSESRGYLTCYNLKIFQDFE